MTGLDGAQEKEKLTLILRRFLREVILREQRGELEHVCGLRAEHENELHALDRRHSVGLKFGDVLGVDSLRQVIDQHHTVKPDLLQRRDTYMRPDPGPPQAMSANQRTDQTLKRHRG